MTSLLQMLKGSSGTGGVQEDALMAVGTLTEVVGTRFIGYLDAFKVYLLAGLQNKAEYQVRATFMLSGKLFKTWFSPAQLFESLCVDVMDITYACLVTRRRQAIRCASANGALFAFNEVYRFKHITVHSVALHRPLFQQRLNLSEVL